MNTTPQPGSFPFGHIGIGRGGAVKCALAHQTVSHPPTIVFDKRAGYETFVSEMRREPLPQGPVLCAPLLTRPAPATQPTFDALDVAAAFGIAGVRS